MKYTEFTYTDAKGKVTNRKVMVIQEPSNKLIGIEMGEMEPEDRVAFMAEYNNLLQQFIEAVNDLKADFDVTHNLRQFIETNIKDRV